MSLLARWKLDETSGTTVADSVGSNNGTASRNASLLHVGAGNGPGGSLASAGFDFDRSLQDYVDIASALGLTNAPLSYAAWIKTSISDAGCPVAIFDHRASGTSGTILYVDGPSPNVGVAKISWAGSIGVTSSVSSSPKVNNGQWRHLLGVCATSSPFAKIYVDGVLVGSYTAQGGAMSVSTPPRIGGRPYAGADIFFDGAIADVRAYNSDESGNVASIIDDARPTCSVTISGTPNVGELFTATPLTNDSTATFEYQWYRADNASGLNEAAISGATSSTYTTQAADEGKYLRCRGRSTNTGGAGLQSAYAYSAYSAQVTAGGGSHSLTANNLATGTPSVGSPALTQAHSLVAVGVTAGAPALGAPALGQVHALAAAGIAAGAPVLGSPALSQAGELVADPLASGAPVLGTPALSQHHVLTATGLATGAPAAGAPALGQAHALAAAGVTAGAPSTGTPALAGAGSLTALGVTTGPPALGAPQLTQRHALAATGVSAQPVLGAPALAQLHALIAAAIASGAPAIGAPVLVPDVNEVALVTPASRIHLVHSRNRTHEVRVRSRLHLVKRK